MERQEIVAVKMQEQLKEEKRERCPCCHAPLVLNEKGNCVLCERVIVRDIR